MINTSDIRHKLALTLETLVHSDSICGYSLYGSNASGSRVVLDGVVDMDFCIFFKKIDKTVSESIRKICKEIKKEFPTTHVEPGIFYGPFIPKPKKEKITIFLHINAHTETTYSQRHVFFKWSLWKSARKNPGYGDIIERYKPSNRPSIANLLDPNQKSAQFHLNCLLSNHVYFPCRSLTTLEVSDFKVKSLYLYRHYYQYSAIYSLRNYGSTLGIDAEDFESTNEYIDQLSKITGLKKSFNLLRKTSINELLPHNKIYQTSLGVIQHIIELGQEKRISA